MKMLDEDIEIVECYKTKDGIIYEKSEEAIIANAELQFIFWYGENELYGRYEGSKVDVENLLKWLKEHKDVLAPFINLLKQRT
jgi:hypothetical protein